MSTIADRRKFNTCVLPNNKMSPGKTFATFTLTFVVKTVTFKIAAIEPRNAGWHRLSAQDVRIWADVPQAWMDKHKPEVGGYYVWYADDYRSYSPAKAFEEGYTRIG